MPYDNRPERNLEDILKSTRQSSAGAAFAIQHDAQVAKAVRDARLAGYKSPLRRLIARLLSRRRERAS